MNCFISYFFRNGCSEWESLALQYLEDVSFDTISMHHIDGEGVTPTDRLKLGMVLGVPLIRVLSSI